ncbi:cellular disintegrin ADAM 6d precursor [Oryctolagus cuniculus]|uniref:Cellular disintegrin ADAM 6d n=1 Tax=Oryctolagus cuniculus TaxID=9986 RepID=O19050_RABIT|nr:cellular disintegrin ADAM 6d precursor [Oryctolagus cuniculus]AAC09475.1 cellular disintegrin ADAM 6d [Oryctolagus cuniculus]
MVLAEGQVTLLLLGLWVLLDPGQCSPGRPSWRYVSSEVVIPRKELHQGRGVQVAGWLSISLHFGGQRHVICMRSKKLIWARHLMMMTQDDQGALQMDYPYIPTDCYYLGHLEDIPLSTVTIDTCYGGLEGIMKLDDLAYEIKPLKDSNTFEHVVSQIVADRNATGPMYRLEHEDDFDPFFSEVNSSVAPKLSSFNHMYHMAQLKGQIQIAHEMYTVLNNISKCIQFSINMFSIIDSFLRGIGFRHYIALLNIYNQQEPVVMNDFRVPGGPIHAYYKANFHDIYRPSPSTLITRNAPNDDYQEPARYGTCGHHNLLIIGSQGRHYLLLAILTTHKIARQIGLAYDYSVCVCQRRATCLMRKFPEMTDSFSNCSFVHTQHIVSNRYIFTCYYFTDRTYMNKTLIQTRCGNFLVEEREQCDCGSFKHCYANACCQSDCRFTPGSICDKQQCCTNCTYSPTSTLCRPVMNICDLPEYCGGSTYTCPENFYLQDGTPCTEDGYCYRGNCSDPTMHCKEIFGQSAENGPADCYAINLNTFRFGHCRREQHQNVYHACAAQDKECGRLQCINVTQLPQLQDHVSFHQSVYNEFTCFGLDEHRSTGSTDAGRVRDGTPCGEGLFCLESRCNMTMLNLHYDCFPEKCSFRGLCNNNKNCHCHVGWDPPLCLSPGAGGSSQSGPPPRRMRTVTDSMEPILYLRVVFARVYCFIFALLFGVATNVRTIKTTIVQEQTVNEPQ